MAHAARALAHRAVAEVDAEADIVWRSSHRIVGAGRGPSGSTWDFLL
jgi:hypothetical protein